MMFQLRHNRPATDRHTPPSAMEKPAVRTKKANRGYCQCRKQPGTGCKQPLLRPGTTAKTLPERTFRKETGPKARKTPVKKRKAIPAWRTVRNNGRQRIKPDSRRCQLQSADKPDFAVEPAGRTPPCPDSGHAPEHDVHARPSDRPACEEIPENGKMKKVFRKTERPGNRCRSEKQETAGKHESGHPRPEKPDKTGLAPKRKQKKSPCREKP